MPLFAGYFGAIKVGDGLRHHWTTAGRIVAHNEDGTILTICTRPYKNYDRIIWEYKLTRGNKIMKWERFGEFYREYSPKGNVVFTYYHKSLRTLHGMTVRNDQRLFGERGICRTKYSHGRFIWQEFRYANRKIAFRINQNDRTARIKYSNGKRAAIIECPSRGFSTRGGDPERWNGHGNDTHTCFQGALYFNIDQHKKELNPNQSRWNDKRPFDFSKDGNTSFVIYDQRGRVSYKGEYRNRQRTAEWISGYKSVFLLHGITVSKKLWSTPPEKLKVKSIFRIQNAQLRAALLAKVGPERIAKEAKSKIIHQTKNGMRLMEFPIKVDDGNGGKKSFLRILRVQCPSTKNFYYLNVPDFVWDAGRKTKLNTCEAARQWTFGVDDPRKTIKFAVET